jgi:hypothetical protein
MGLFNKKLSLEEILKAIEGLSDEEKAQVKAKMEESATVEETPEANIEPSEEAQSEIEQPEATENVEAGAEELIEQAPETQEPTPEAETQPETEQLNGVEQDNKEDVMSGFANRLTAVEEKLAQLDELKELMEKYTKKQADSFGYKGAIPGVKKDINDMSASELKEKMLNGEI